MRHRVSAERKSVVVDVKQLILADRQGMIRKRGNRIPTLSGPLNSPYAVTLELPAKVCAHTRIKRLIVLAEQVSPEALTPISPVGTKTVDGSPRLSSSARPAVMAPR